MQNPTHRLILQLAKELFFAVHKEDNIMKIGILHLTDLHIKANDNVAIERTEEIISASRFDLEKAERIYIVITGDIIDKGAIQNYSIATGLLENLKDRLNQLDSVNSVKFIIVPGNHDCDFKQDNQLRKITIQAMNYNTLGDDTSVIDLCTGIQASFWEFYKKYNDLPDNKLFYQICDKVRDKTVCFNCLNTAWMSQVVEKEDMFFPIKRFEDKKTLKKGTINISVFHHPMTWFTSSGESNNRKELQQFLEDNSSIILSGHEHESEHKISTEFWSNKETLYFSGHLFYGNSNNSSGFQILTVELNDKKGIIKPFSWFHDIYKEDNFKEFILNGEKYNHKRFKHNSEFISDLDKLRIPVSAENKTEVKLSDFYVFPDLESPESNTKEMDSYYNSEKLISDNKISVCLIEGENQSGKSSLISMLYKRFVDEDMYPLSIDSRNIKNVNIDLLIKQAFNKQYTSGDTLDLERFKQYDKNKKVLLLDNLQLLNFNPRTIRSLVEDFESQFGKVIIMTNTLYGLVAKIEAEFDELITFTLRPLGYKKRNQLIENYHRLSLSPHSSTDEQLLSRTKESFHQVENVLGDKLMPSYPVFIISILQTLVYAKPTNYEQTSYGYCYHSLIHLALVKKAKVDNEFIDTYFNFLSEFALHLYQTDKGKFVVNDLEKFFKDYKEEYHVGFTLAKLKETLLKSQLIFIQDDLWQFSYEYIFYFLVARRIAELISTDYGKDAVRNLCSNLHQEKNAKILVFIAHHTKDDFLIEEATFTAMVPFEDIEPITLNKHGHYYDLIKDIIKEISSDIIESSSNPIESRNEILESRDDIEREREKHEEELKEIEQTEGFDEYMLPFFQAFRALEIVGQIIKNRKGSIPAKQLINMIAELYNTAFRSISFFGKNLLDSKQEFIESLASKLDEGDSSQKVKEKVNSFFQFISLQICLGVFGKVIYSVGQQDLRTLFEKVAEKIDTPAADLVTFSINSYYGNMSTGDLQRIVKKYEKNHVAMEIIKARVKSYLYQNYVDFRKRQSFADTLHMRIGPARR